MTSTPFYKKKRIWTLLLLALLFVPYIFTTASTQASRGGDFRIFLVAGDRLIHGTMLYEGSKVASWVTWPPFFAVFIAPFTLLAKVSLPLTQVFWYLLTTLLFFLAIGEWVRIMHGKPFGWFDESKGISLYSPVILIPIVLVYGPFYDNVSQLQLGTVLLFLMTLGIRDLGRHNRQVRAGFWFGVAAALKAFPVLIIVYLVYRKKIKATASMIATGGLLTLLPVLRYGFYNFFEMVRTWISISFSGGYPLGGLNQSVYALVARFAASDPFVLMVKRIPSPSAGDPGVMAATWIYRGLFVLFIIALIFVLNKRNYRNNGVEGAFFIVLITVFSPISWQHYYVLMMPAFMVLTMWWLDKKDDLLKWATLGAGIMMTGIYILGYCAAPIGAFLRCVLSHYTLGAFMLLAGLLRCVYKNYGNQSGLSLQSPGLQQKRGME
jgi:hypothetical protein